MTNEQADAIVQHAAASVEIANRRRMLEIRLRERHVSPAIIERVMRLNPDPQPGEIVRGIHYKRHQDHAFWRLVSKGAFIRSNGRAAWGRIPVEEHRKYGKRVYISWEAACDFGGAAVTVSYAPLNPKGPDLTCTPSTSPASFSASSPSHSVSARSG